MKKESLKIIIKIIIFIIIGFVLLQIATNLLMPKWTTTKDNRMTYIMRGFYKEPKNSLDVVFMGNSDVYRGVSPIKLWDEYGIASYNYVSSGQRMWTAYYMMEECLKYQKPKLIVLNMDSAFIERKSTESNYRKTFDNMKLSLNKIKAITDPVFKNSKEDILSYILPITRYHSRWSELNDNDFYQAFQNKRFEYKGMDLVATVKPYNNGYDYMEKDNSDEEIGENCLKYLEKMVNLCKENNIELLLIEIPSADSWSKDLSDKVTEFANNHDVDFIDMNLNASEFGFDWTTDTSDGGDHLNVYGAEKVSEYLGNIIQEKYDIPNHKNDLEYKRWYDDSKVYNEDKQLLEDKN